MRNMIAIFALLMLLFFLGRAYAQPPLYVVDLSRATTHEKLITLSLQGLANRSPETPSIYTLSGEQDEGWLSWIERLDPRPTERVSPQQLLEQFRHLAKGQILCEPSDSTSLNMATSLAGLRDGIVSDRDLGLPTLFDTRGKFRSVLEAYQWAAKEILPQCSQKGLVLLGSSIGFRDYVIREKLLALPMTTLGDKAAWRLLSRMAASFPAGTPILAPAPERIHPAIIKWGARVGHPLFGVEEAANLSYHSQLETPTFSQWRRYVELGAKIYVCFIFSGGDDLSYAQRRMSDLWRQAERGALPLGWALPAPMAGIAPDILQYYFAGAYRSGHDGFVLQVNSPSVSKPRTLHAPLVQAREATDIRSLVVIDESSDKALLPAVEELAVHFQPSGIFVPDHKSLPSKVIGESVIFTKGFSGSNADEILKRLSALPATKGGLIFVWVDSKSVSPADIFSVASLLPSYFEVVAPDEFIFLAKQVLSGEAFEVPSQTKVNLIAPASVGPDESFIVRAAIPGAKVKEALLIYQQESGIQLVEPMGRRGPDGEYSVHLGPLLHSGEWLLQARVSEGEGVVSWSEVVRLQVSPEDPDEDGLSAAAERFFGTDLASADTDNDGLLDGSDPHPLTLNSSPAVYFGPLAPVDDAPFLVEDSGSILEDNVRKVRADNYFVYHLFLEGLPPGARAVLAMRLSGTARAAFSADGKKFDTPFNLQETDGWTTAPVPAELLRSRTLFIRISAAEEPPAELSLRKLAILSPLDAPSIGLPALVPPYFGPGLPVGVSVDLWDPQTVTQAWCAYRSGRGFISVPLEQPDKGPTWATRLGQFDNARRLDWWVVARNSEGRRSSSRMMHAWVGTFPGETLHLFANKELNGGWRRTEMGWGPARETDRAGITDWAELEVTGGSYEVWALVAGRGREVGIWADGNLFTNIDASAPDDWQHLGKIRLAEGEHRVELISGAGREGATARYSQLIFTSISSFLPPPKGRLEMQNCLILSSPLDGEKIGSRTQVSGTASGDIARVEFLVDGELLRRFSSPPFSFVWDSGRLSEGKHILQMVGIGRARRPVATLEVEVEFTKEKTPETR